MRICFDNNDGKIKFNIENANLIDLESTACIMIDHIYNDVLKDESDKEDFKNTIKRMVENDIVFKSDEEKEKAKPEIIAKLFYEVLKERFEQYEKEKKEDDEGID